MIDPDFLTFWSLYPRRVSKKDAETAWKKLTPDQKFAALKSLPIHVRYWQLAGTSKDYLPYPGSWIRGERWTDELEIPVSKADPDWHRSKEGIARKAQEVGITPKPGEDWHSLKSRILAKVAA